MFWPQGYNLPGVMTQKARRLRDKVVHCCVCGRRERKYVCAKSNRVTCSLQCYKQSLVN